MRKLILWNLITLDGCFDGAAPWALDWHLQVWGEELERFSLDQLHGAAGLVFGRRTYEGMAAYWAGATGEVADLMNALPKMVCSRTLKHPDWRNTRLAAGDALEAVRALKAEGEGDLYVFGSGELANHLAAGGLFEEFRLCLVPTILGTGRALFPAGTPGFRLKLLEARPLASGAVVLRYEPENRGN